MSCRFSVIILMVCHRVFFFGPVRQVIVHCLFHLLDIVAIVHCMKQHVFQEIPPFEFPRIHQQQEGLMARIADVVEEVRADEGVDEHLVVIIVIGDQVLIDPLHCPVQCYTQTHHRSSVDSCSIIVGIKAIEVWVRDNERERERDIIRNKDSYLSLLKARLRVRP